MDTYDALLLPEEALGFTPLPSSGSNGTVFADKTTAARKVVKQQQPITMDIQAALAENLTSEFTHETLTSVTDDMKSSMEHPSVNMFKVEPLVIPSDNESTSLATCLSENQRRKRHNASERKRTNAFKTRILSMREELVTLEKQREEMEQQLVVAPKQNNVAFLETVNLIDKLRRDKLNLEQQLRQKDMQNSTYQTILTEFGGLNRSSQRIRTGGGGRYYEHDSSSDEDEDSGNALDAEDAPVFQRVLFSHPVSVTKAMEWVKSSYEEIMRFRNRREFDSLGGKVLGWRDQRRLDSEKFEFMLSQQFRSALAPEMVHKTWNLLTNIKLYRRIQSRTTDLKILQRVHDDCVIVRVSVLSNTNEVHSSILLIARGRIDNGYLVTYRSIPLSTGKQAFADDPDNKYVTLFNWYMFLETQTNKGEPACEVIFGGKVRNKSDEYLRYLMVEVVAGVVRWQTAVGHSTFRLTT